MRPLLLAALLALPSLPALASDLAPSDIAAKFCAARLAGDMTPVFDILTPALRGLVEGKTAIWSGVDSVPARCEPMGASGNFDHPVAVLFLTFPDGSTTSDRLILNFVDGNLRIDDVGFRGGKTLRGEFG